VNSEHEIHTRLTVDNWPDWALQHVRNDDEHPEISPGKRPSEVRPMPVVAVGTAESGGVDALELPATLSRAAISTPGYSASNVPVRTPALQTIKSNVDKALRTAIEQARLIRFFYQNKDRVVEPHD
jgi:hypothetical protein